jgi:hypothetical protein
MIELVEIETRLGTHWLLAWEYAECFRVKRDGTITVANRLRIFTDLARLLDACEFVYDGRRYRTDHGKIKAALQTVCDLDKYGFKNHNYLKKVMMDDAEKVSAEGMTAGEESQRIKDQGLRKKEKEGDECWPESVEEIKARLGVERMADLVGKRAKNIGHGAEGKGK